MPTTKATPKCGVTLFSYDKSTNSPQFVHSPSGSADFDLKHKLGKRVTLGVGFTVRDDVTLNLAHNFGNKATKTGITVDTKVGGKKTTLKAKYITKGNAFTGEVVSSIAPNKKATINFTEREVCNNQFLFEAFFIDRAMMLARLCLTWFATC
eukprot:jgi/Chrzof1/2059/Cz11g01120.t1